jgi:hypothetical protein
MSRTSHDQALLYNSKYKDKFREKLAALHERYVSDKQTVDDDKRLYEDYLRKFADYPIVVLDSGDWNRLNNVYHLNLHDYFAAVCKEQNWIHVHVARQPNGSLYLELAKNARTPKLISNLMMIANQQNSGVSLTFRSRRYEFWFRGENGEQVFELWLEQCKRDDLFQMILGFYPKKENAL